MVNRSVDALVSVVVEVAGLQDLGHLVDGFVQEQNTAQHASLGFEVLRRQFVDEIRRDLSNRHP